MTTAIRVREAASVRPAKPKSPAAPGIEESALTARIRGILNRWPAVGLALGVVRDGRLEFFRGHGLADIPSKTPVTEDTVFRIGSITKTFTAIAVMQLWEQGLVDLDAPANDYLHAYKLIPADARFRPATLRHLLTHTAGIPEVVHISDVLHPDWGPFEGRPATYSVKVGERMPSLAAYYRGGLRIVVEPGTTFAYTNHGFATLGQIVEDVSGMPLRAYLREHIFEPLGMADTDLVRTERVASNLATGYVIGRSGPNAVPDREWIGAGGGSIYSTTRDVGRYVAALLGDGANRHGSVLNPTTLATMFQPQYQPDWRLTAMGLGFFRHDAGGHLVVAHDGILPGFNSGLVVAPGDGIGLIAFTNGSSGAMSWLPSELRRLLNDLLGVSDAAVRTDIPHHTEIWGEICGRYRLPPRISDLRGRVATAAGIDVFVRGGRLMLRVRLPVPSLYRGLPLHPDDENDPYVFRLDLSPLGMPTVRLVFGRDLGRGTTALHTDLLSQPLSLYKRCPATDPASRSHGHWGVLTAAAALTTARRRGRGSRRARSSTDRTK